MSCNGSTYSSTCCPEVPYPQISSESVPSLIDNLVYALYGTINKSVVNGRVVWDIPCDPASSPAEVPGVPRNEGEGLLCYIIRVLDEDIVLAPNVVDTISVQTITGQKTFTQNIIGNVVGDVFASDGTTKVLENGTGANATFTGNVTGNVTGNLTGDVTGNLTGNVTGNVIGNLTGAASLNVLKSGDTMTGALIVPAGATGSQVPRVSEVVAKTGDTMTGGLVVSTNTSSDALKIKQIGTGAALLVEDDPANPDTTPFIITNTGDVGIGKTTPTQKLDVVGNIACTGTIIINGSTFDNTLYPSFFARIKGDIADITSITSITYIAAGGGADVTITKTSHGLLVDDSITFVGQTGNNIALNGTWKIGSADANTFTFLIPSFPASLLAAGITALLPIRPVRFISVFDSGYGYSTPNSIGRDANGSYQLNFYNIKANANYLAFGNACNSGIAPGTFSPFGYSTSFFSFKTYALPPVLLTPVNFSDINIQIY